ncbi:UNVERIFIED_CONTAM: hypothetical protein FKN15_072209, partial [Acipenser sinensis]
PAAPRTDKMTVDQDWSSVYPTAASFKPSTVPLPIRMGYPVKRGVPLEKKGNLELIKRLQQLRQRVAVHNPGSDTTCGKVAVFCTKWPETLDSEAKCEQHFPIQVKMTDFVFAGPSVRNPKARVTTLTVKVSSLNLDDHGRKKLIKLAGERHNKETDMLTFTADRENTNRSAYRKTSNNYQKHEPWEKEKTEADMEEYLWESSTSERNALETLLRMKGSEDGSALREELLSSRPMQEYRNSVTNLKNAGESESTLLQYKESKHEPWEKEKTEADMEEYLWESSTSERNALETLLRMKGSEDGSALREELLSSRPMQEYRNSVTNLKNAGESESTLLQYKESVKNLLNL